ncbi:hypothetical protein ACCS91_23690 [Rhizobium ruizarguesonis]|uniref:hypothetical protein n=1 Tax=Rhizobium ruizarguesonis TaxID=2081791 RepID=UPI00102FF5C9|nr:hypothetical protein [Rhizobium ruizarguesonis]TAW77439.1 hypothetical protein ELI10_09680 [Rhizobium ruizarguesonis]TAX14405.1 hypothetical protein ELI09_09740 [Rhizobium ruizarguesonis]TAX19236.1 hypothetical protein ELI08_09740 [Rhizobium ruizarguesonis]
MAAKEAALGGICYIGPEKRQLDAFRMQERHPAATVGDLPEEVRLYIARLELENYDFKQEQAVGGNTIASLLGAVTLGVCYFGVHIQPVDSIWLYFIGLFLMISPWFHYRWAWNRNADALFPQRHGGPNLTDENIRKEWELEFLASRDPQDGSKL